MKYEVTMLEVNRYLVEADSEREAIDVQEDGAWMECVTDHEHRLRIEEAKSGELSQPPE